MKLGVKRNHAKAPAGGHRFPIGSMFLRAPTVEEILAKIEVFRAENAEPLGFPESDLAEYYRGIAPHLVREEEGKWSKSIKQEWAERIMAFWKNHPPLIKSIDPLVSKRITFCDRCPQMVPMFVINSQDGPYVKEANRRAQLLSESRAYADYGFCVWSLLPVTFIVRTAKPEELPGLPDAPKVCWVNAL